MAMFLHYFYLDGRLCFSCEITNGKWFEKICENNKISIILFERPKAVGLEQM